MEKKLFFNKEQIDGIIEKYPTPFHLYDEKGIRENVRALQKAFSWNKGYKEYFAVKANPNPYILQLLKDEGCGMDCSSYTELYICDKLGFDADDIMFTSNQTPVEDFKFARALNATITLDDIEHIDYLDGIAGLPETISLRYNPGEFEFANDIMSNAADAKYGFTTEQLVEGVKKLKDRGVKAFGLHAFLASNTDNEDYYPELAKLLFETAVMLKKELGVKIDFINLSGGVGVPYTPEQEKVNIANVGEKVRRAYEAILTPEGMDDVKIYNELGRFVMAPYGCLVTKVLHEKHTHKDYVGLDACASNLMRPMMYGAYHHITVMGKENVALTHQYDVVGGLCENSDKFAIDRMLPEVKVGDVLVMHDTGAHGHAMGYTYNGKLRSAEILLKEDGSTSLIRRAETVEDYFATIDFSDLETN